MKIVRLLGGLGNQMFQYAFYLSLIEKGFEAKIDITQLLNYKLHNGYELERIFNVKPNIASYSEICKLSRNRKNDLISRISRKLLPPKSTEYLENTYSIYDKKVFLIDGDTYYQGYWHNEKYFIPLKEKVLDTFKFKNRLNSHNQNILDKIRQTQSVSIHIRRGDYVKHPYLAGICSNLYYKQAISYIKSHVNNPKFFIFSDDIDWCKNNILEPNSYFIDWNKNRESYIDMQLMSNCRYNIIANSSFSWWGAWLNNSPNKIVICPSQWNSRDLNLDNIPSEWIRINS